MEKGAPLLFLFEVSIVVLIDFIAILLTPGIFLIQIVNTNNTNMHLIHFYSENNIKMHFPKSWVLKFQTRFRHLLSIATRWNKLRWHQQRLTITDLEIYLKKQNIIIYTVKKCNIFFIKIEIIFKNKWKSNLNIGLQSVVVHTILSRMCFFFLFWDKNWGNRFWVRPT